LIDLGRSLDLAGAPAVTIRRLMLPLTLAVIAIGSRDARAQGAFPAPLLPGQAAPSGASPFPPVNGAAPIAGVTIAPSPQAGWSQDQCRTDFQPLREEAERRGKLIKAASDRHATPDEACKLIGNFAQAEIKIIKFVEAHATQCGNLAQVAQLRDGHGNTENMQRKVCAMVQQRSPPGPVGDFPPWYF
jgi:hypothetical protein